MSFLTPHLLAAVIVLLLVVLTQRFWFFESRRWLLSRASTTRRPRLRTLHSIGFFLLIAAMAYTAATQRYRITPAKWWDTAFLSVYFVSSFFAGVSLMTAREIAGLRRRRGAARAGVLPRNDGVRQPSELPPSDSAPAKLPLRTLDPGAGASESPHPRLVGRRGFVLAATGAAIALPIAGSVYGLSRERLDVRTEHVPLALGPVAAPLRGRSIVQISDIHIGPFFTARDLRRVVDTINELNPDIVFLTGDFVTFRGESQYECVRELDRLKPKTAVLGCLGNHEIYTHTQASITRLFAANGTDILRFRGHSVELGSGRLNIAGVDFLRLGEESRVLEVAPFFASQAGGLNVLLSHNPNAFDHLRDMPVHLCLSGHTHGGQLRLELLGISISPADLMTRYVSGMFERGGRRLYVNRGLGTIGVPIRFGAPPEITLYEFV